MQKKVSRLESQQRIFQVVEWIIQGMPVYKLDAKIAEEFGIGSRQIKRYKEKAMELWRVDVEADLINKRNLRIDDLKNDIANLDPKYKGTPAGLTAVLRIKKEISKLEDLYPARKIQVKNDPDNPIGTGGDTLNQTVIFQIPDNNRG